MNRHIFWLTICQGWFMTNNVAFIAINGLVGLQLAPQAWMATLPVMAYVVGSAMATGLVARTQKRFGRKTSFQLGLLVAIGSVLICALAAWLRSFELLLLGTTIAGYYSANGNLYRFAAAELASPVWREKAVSVVMAGGLLGAVLGPNLAAFTRQWIDTPFVAVYLVLAAVALVSMVCMTGVHFPEPTKAEMLPAGRTMREIASQPVFIVAALCSALGYGVMSLIMTSTPLAMQICGLPFEDTALVLEWHVIGMFAPGFFTGSLIKKFGTHAIIATGLFLMLACAVIALSGTDVQHFTWALFLLGVGWNFVYTGGTTLSMRAYRPEEKDIAQAALNRIVFVTMAITALSSGVLISNQGWDWLQWGSLMPIALMAMGLIWLARRPDRLANVSQV
jgi:predicted MFS family arabinose efflux permease